jgi:3-oxoacyl-[acyl-carrier protein] reductase
MNLGIENRIAIVTGSSQGIGRAIAHGLAKEGVTVVICARNKERLQKTAEEITHSTGGNVLSIRTDLRKKNDIKRLVEKTIDEFNTVDILVNNTGGPPSMLFSDTSEDHWQDAYTLLLMSTIHCCHKVVPYMKKKKWGRIINMTSFAAKQPAERLILSNTVRAGILGLTKTLSNELAVDGILVNAVCPGWTLTKRVQELARSTAEKTGKKYDEVIQEWADNIPLHRLAQPEEIANLVVFLASERASYITGAVITADGGHTRSLL